jgi:hypothetical protein
MYSDISKFCFPADSFTRTSARVADRTFALKAGAGPKAVPEAGGQPALLQSGCIGSVGRRVSCRGNQYDRMSSSLKIDAPPEI